MSSDTFSLSLRQVALVVAPLIVAVAVLGLGAPQVGATSGTYTLAQLAQDDLHVVTRVDAEQRTAPRESQRRPWPEDAPSIRAAAVALGHPAGRWPHTPPGWRGPPVLLI